MFRPMSRTAYALAAAALAALALPGNAVANGRFPATVNVHVQPGNDQTILVGATFGALLSTDDGQEFHWICENAIGYGGTFDPKYRIAADGTLFATTFDGLRISRDGGCTWDLVGGPLTGHWVDWIEISEGGDVWVTTSSGGMANDVFRSTDNGDTFEAMGLENDRVWWKSLYVADTDPDRIYVSGYLVAETLPDGGMVGPEVRLFRSIDGGASWDPLPTGDMEFAQIPQLMLAGVDPTDEDIVFARSVTANPPVGDKLYRSVDGGLSWELVLDTQDLIKAFVFRDNGQIVVGTINDGVRVSDDGGDTWMDAPTEPQMACLAQRDDGELFSCGANWDPDNFAIARSDDGMQTWTKILRFSEMAGPLSCPAGTIQTDTCAAKLWPSLAEQFGIGRVDAGPGDMDGGDVDGGPGANGGGGCCQSSGGPGGSAALALLVALALLAPSPRRGHGRGGGT